MNSIEDLNFTTKLIEYDDPRPSAVIFNKGSPTNGTQSVLEGQSFTSYYGIEIVNIINYDEALVTFTVDVSDNEYCTVSWDDLPSYCSIVNVSSGVYKVVGIRSVGDWNIVKQANINLPYDYFGSFSYECKIQSAVGPTKTWTVSVTVQDILEWNTTQPADYWYPVGSAAVANVPQLIDAANPIESWYCLITPSEPSAVTSLTTNGIGGSTSLNPTTKQLTINGTNAQINSHLASLVLATAGAGETFFNIQYRVTNLINGQSDSVQQNLKPAAIRYLTSASASITYNEDTQFAITGNPQITHTEAAGGETYTLTVTPSATAAVRTMTTAGTGGSTAFNSTSKVLTLIGTKDQVNSHLAAITVQPGQDYTSNFTVTYFLSISPGGYNQSKTQTMNIGNVHAEVANITLTRNFVNGVSALLFPDNVPEITDLDPDPGNYTVTLSVASGVGTFSATGTTTSNNWSYTGTKSQVNTKLGQVTFNPATNYYQNTTVTYTQSKPGFNQVNTTFNLDGPDVAFTSQTTTNASITAIEGDTFSLIPGNNILGVNDYSTTSPVYTISFDIPGLASVSWPVVPSGCIVSNPSAGVYRITGITGATVWNQIKSPNINLNSWWYGSAKTITATISWNNFANSLAWTNTYVVSDVDLLSTTTPMTFDRGVAFTLTGTPQIVDVGTPLPASYSVTVTPSTTSAISSMSCTNGSFNSTTKVLTITGTKTQVNNALAAITVTVPSGFNSDFIMTYYATNNGDGVSTGVETSIKTQILNNSITTYLSAVRGNIDYYPSDSTSSIYYGPTITSTETGTFTLKIKSIPDNVFQTLSSAGSGGTSTWDSTNKILTLSGTKDQINARLDYITMTQSSGYNSNILLSYELTTPANIVSSKFQILYATATETLVSDIHLMRRYQKNYANTLFSTNVPQITDTAVSGDTYTVTLTSTLGEFGVNNAGIGSTWTYTGTKTQVNSVFSQIKFYPTLGITNSGTITYTQSKNGTLQVTRNFFLLYNNVEAVTTLTFTNSTTWTVPYEYKKYGIDALLVAGGGGGVNRNGGAGGGGGVKEIFNIQLTNSTYSVTVGGGGSALYLTSTPTSNVSGTAGGNTSAFGHTVNGGLGGLAGPTLNADAKTGGDSGYPSTSGLTVRNIGGRNAPLLSNGNYAGGSGGGAGVTQNGGDGPTAGAGGNGGDGILSNIPTIPQYFGGGGGGAGSKSPTVNGYPGQGGLGGGGNGGYSIFYADGSQINYAADPGTTNTGGGGGGGQASVGTGISYGGDGGSGVVIVRIHKD